jgi:hypothetical protein
MTVGWRSRVADRVTSVQSIAYGYAAQRGVQPDAPPRFPSDLASDCPRES